MTTYPPVPADVPCRRTDPDRFHPEPGRNAEALAAAGLCRGCPILLPCLTYAVRHEPQGVWGGTTPKQRARLRAMSPGARPTRPSKTRGNSTVPDQPPPPPSRRDSVSPAAGRHGYDIDDIAVERAANGDRSIHLNRYELAAAFRVLQRRGHSALRIAETLGVAERTVIRWRVGAHTPVSRPPGGRTSPQKARTRRTCPDCGLEVAAHLARHRRRQHAHQMAA
jgi:WhiB family redox-sensing transcriptional regulator